MVPHLDSAVRHAALIQLSVAGATRAPFILANQLRGQSPTQWDLSVGNQSHSAEPTTDLAIAVAIINSDSIWHFFPIGESYFCCQLGLVFSIKSKFMIYTRLMYKHICASQSIINFELDLHALCAIMMQPVGRAPMLYGFMWLLTSQRRPALAERKTCFPLEPR